MHSSRAALVVALGWLFGNGFSAPRQFIHPGTVLTKPQMDFAHAQAMAGKEPWKTEFAQWQGQFQAMLDSNYTPRAKSQIARTLNKADYENDAMAMFVNGVMWNMTGKDRHAAKVVQLLNAWDTVCCDFPDGTDFALLFGYGLQFMMYGADLIHHYPGFTETERQKARTFLTMLKDRAMSSYTRNGRYPYVPSGWPSWGAGLGRFLMAYGIYAEDSAVYDEAKSYFFRTGADGADNGTVMTAFLDNGQELEMGRDIYYAQLSLGGFLEWSRMAWNQGDSELFEARGGVLGKAMEYLGRYNLGDSVAWEPFELHAPVWQTASPVPQISTGNRGRYRNIWHLAFEYYHGVKGMDMPYTRKVLDTIALEKTSSTFTDQVGYGALFFNNQEQSVSIFSNPRKKTRRIPGNERFPTPGYFFNLNGRHIADENILQR